MKTWMANIRIDGLGVVCALFGLGSLVLFSSNEPSLQRAKFWNRPIELRLSSVGVQLENVVFNGIAPKSAPLNPDAPPEFQFTLVYDMEVKEGPLRVGFSHNDKRIDLLLEMKRIHAPIAEDEAEMTIIVFRRPEFDLKDHQPLPKDGVVAPGEYFTDDLVIWICVPPIDWGSFRKQDGYRL